jgi:hypothetical protein
MLLIGLAVGFRPSQPFYDVVLAFVLVLAFAHVFAWISAYAGDVRRLADRAGILPDRAEPGRLSQASSRNSRDSTRPHSRGPNRRSPGLSRPR